MVAWPWSSASPRPGETFTFLRYGARSSRRSRSGGSAYRRSTSIDGLTCVSESITRMPCFMAPESPSVLQHLAQVRAERHRAADRIGGVRVDEIVVARLGPAELGPRHVGRQRRVQLRARPHGRTRRLDDDPVAIDDPPNTGGRGMQLDERLRAMASQPGKIAMLAVAELHDLVAGEHERIAGSEVGTADGADRGLDVLGKRRIAMLEELRGVDLHPPGRRREPCDAVVAARRMAPVTDLARHAHTAWVRAERVHRDARGRQHEAVAH